MPSRAQAKLWDELSGEHGSWDNLAAEILTLQMAAYSIYLEMPFSEILIECDGSFILISYCVVCELTNKPVN